MYNTYKIIRYIIYVLEIYILHSLDQTPGLTMEIFGARSLAALSGFVCISLFEKEFTSMMFGILVGLLIDFSSGSVLGVNALILGLTGYILGVICSYFVRTNFLSAIFISGLVSLIVTGVDFCLHYVLSGASNKLIWNIWYLPIVIHTMAVALPIYFFNRTISYCTRERQNEKYRY